MADLTVREAWEERRLNVQLPTTADVEEFFDMALQEAFYLSVHGQDPDREILPASVRIHPYEGFDDPDVLLDAITAKHVDDYDMWRRIAGEPT